MHVDELLCHGENGGTTINGDNMEYFTSRLYNEEGHK